MTLLARLPVPERPPERVRQAVDEVLARAEYDSLRPTLLQRIWEAIRDAWEALLSGLAGSGQGGALGALVLIVSALLLGWLVIRLLGRMRRDPGARSGLDEQLGRTPGSWRREAEERSAAAQWRLALRCHYRAALAELAARGHVDEQPGRTTGEHLLAVRRSLPEAGPAFADLTAAFDEAWYGAAELGAAEVARAAELAAAVENAGRVTVGGRA